MLWIILVGNVLSSISCVKSISCWKKGESLWFQNAASHKFQSLRVNKQVGDGCNGVFLLQTWMANWWWSNMVVVLVKKNMIVMMKYAEWKGWEFVWSSFFIFWIASYHNVPRRYHCVSHSSISCPANQQPTLSLKWTLDTVGDRHSWSHPKVAKKLRLF